MYRSEGHAPTGVLVRRAQTAAHIDGPRWPFPKRRASGDRRRRRACATVARPVATRVPLVKTELPTPTFATVGVVGAGQLARMMGEASAAAAVRVSVLASSTDDCAVAACARAIIGSARDVNALRALAQSVDVVTFDHELVDLEVLELLERDGVVLRPSPSSLRYGVDKAFQRRALAAAGIPVPRFVTVGSGDGSVVDKFLDELDGPPVVKSARGGYDGRGVAFPRARDEARSLVAAWSRDGEVVVEERLNLRGEVAQIVARSVYGDVAFYPTVATAQRDGTCVEVRSPSGVTAANETQVHELTRRLAELIKPVGVMAVEYFVTESGVTVNEVALRPHNSGHWTIEGTSASQFVQHLRAVSGQRLGEITLNAEFAVMVNVLGGDSAGSLDDARAVPGVFVHDYGKAWRPGRKLGHVTALGDEPDGPHVRAWTSARAYGTSTREA